MCAVIVAGSVDAGAGWMFAVWLPSLRATVWRLMLLIAHTARNKGLLLHAFSMPSLCRTNVITYQNRVFQTRIVVLIFFFFF